jgi:hypothetical protein
MGREVTAILGTCLGLLVLAVLPFGEQWIGQGNPQKSLIQLPEDNPGPGKAGAPGKPIDGNKPAK